MFAMHCGNTYISAVIPTNRLTQSTAERCQLMTACIRTLQSNKATVTLPIYTCKPNNSTLLILGTTTHIQVNCQWHMLV